MLKFTDLHVTFHPNTINERIALDGVSYELKQGDFVSVLGTNGAGKSTLLNSIAGTVELDSGNILLDDMDITWMKEYKRAKYIGRLFQDPMKGTAPNMTILENLGLAYSRGKRSTLSKAIKKSDIPYFQKQLAKLQLGLENRLDTKVGLLSGGQRQALTLLMATLVTPNLLLLDEHTAALDPKTADTIMEVTNTLIQEEQIPTLMITHNIKQALQYGNKLLIMNEGRIVRELNQEEKKTIRADALLELYHALD
ncbi:MAG: ATP-binding cassette domain-containing protein [Erysipelotrichaceae bacterium]|nr:ATP-binding cassette domain-containing protein [Erysipelotrichaceae bacterium]